MTKVFFLRHLEEKREDGSQGYKTIGVYSTAEKAGAACGRLRDMPGFKDFPERWIIDERTVDEDDWADGFDKETHARISNT